MSRKAEQKWKAIAEGSGWTTHERPSGSKRDILSTWKWATKGAQTTGERLTWGDVVDEILLIHEATRK